MGQGADVLAALLGRTLRPCGAGAAGTGARLPEGRQRGAGLGQGPGQGLVSLVARAHICGAWPVRSASSWASAINASQPCTACLWQDRTARLRRAPQAALVAAVEATGFEARVLSSGALGGAAAAAADTAALRVRGMTCAACAAAVERACLGVPGVCSAAVSLLAGRAEVAFDPDRTGPRHLLAAVEAAGFEAALADSDRCAPRRRAPARKQCSSCLRILLLCCGSVSVLLRVRAPSRTCAI